MRHYVVAAVLAVLALVPLHAGAQTASPREVAAPWSAVVDGVRARLIVAPATDANGHAQVRIDVEVENVSPTRATIDVFCGDFAHALAFALVDDSGRSLPELHPGGNELAAPPGWRHLARGAPVRMTVTPRAYEYVPDGRVLFRPRVFQAWEITSRPAGRLHVSATLAQGTPDHPSAHAWRGGSIALAAVALP